MYTLALRRPKVTTATTHATKTSMGDFSAGKMLGPDGVEIAPVHVADFDQFVTDVDGSGEFAKSVNAGPGGAPPEIIDNLTRMISVGTDGELLLCLKQWRDADCNIFVDGTSYRILTAEVITSCSVAPGQAFQMGADMDDSPLFMTPDGVLLTEGGGDLVEVPERTLGAALGMFRTHLLRNKIEWIDGWVETGA